LTRFGGLVYIADPPVSNTMPSANTSAMSSPATTAAAAPAVTAGARQRRKDARPNELLDAALDLFVEKGFAATRAEEVAQRAGVSKGTLYLYYPSKEELFKAVIARNLSSRIADTAQQVQAWHGEMAPLLESLLVQWWQQTYASPASGTFKILVSEVRNFPEIAEYYVQQVIEPGSALIGGIVARGVASGEFGAVDVESVVHSLVLPMVMLCVHKHGLAACSQHQIDGHRFIAEHVALVVRGLRGLRGRASPVPDAAAKARRPRQARP
jgi:AcrR family transcriptional regulator